MPKTSSYEYVICPHCGYQHGDCWEWVQIDYESQMECSGCGRTIVYWAECDVTYYARDIEGGKLLKAALNK